MASIYIGVNRGADTQPDVQSGGITEGASTGSTDLEIRIDTGKGWTREEITRTTKRLLDYLNDGRTTIMPL